MTANFFIRVLKSARYRLLSKPYNRFLAPMVARYIAGRRDFKPEIVVMIDGGLGSQMWQYGLGRGARLASGLPVSYDLSWYARGAKDINGVDNRSYELTSIFPGLPFQEAQETISRAYRKYFNAYPGTRFHYEEDILSSKSPRYLGGYYINAKYIDRQGDALRELFRFDPGFSEQNRLTHSRIVSAPYPVAVHVRRGDYVGSVHDVTTPGYFHSAIRHIADKLAPEKATFFVFSNGMEWCKETLAGLDEDFVFVEENDNDRGARDMYLMSCCSHFIISNSSFSWWAAWLGMTHDKIVVMPDKWLACEKGTDRLAMRAEGWTVLSAG